MKFGCCNVIESQMSERGAKDTIERVQQRRDALFFRFRFRLGNQEPVLFDQYRIESVIQLHGLVPRESFFSQSQGITGDHSNIKVFQ